MDELEQKMQMEASELMDELGGLCDEFNKAMRSRQKKLGLKIVNREFTLDSSEAHVRIDVAIFNSRSEIYRQTQESE